MKKAILMLMMTLPLIQFPYFEGSYVLIPNPIFAPKIKLVITDSLPIPGQISQNRIFINSLHFSFNKPTKGQLVF
jgi:hypothetical protein